MQAILRKSHPMRKRISHLPPVVAGLSFSKGSLMMTSELIAYGAGLLFLACAFKIVRAKTLTIRLYGIKIKAEGSITSQRSAND